MRKSLRKKTNAGLIAQAFMINANSQMELRHLLRISTLKWTLAFSLLITVGFAPLILNQPGLEQAAPMGKYLNGIFPASLVSKTGVGAATAFPDATFAYTLVMTAEPRSNRFHIAAQFGVIEFVNADQPQEGKQNFLNIADRVWTGQDSGVLGMAFHPDYNDPDSPNRNYVYVYYTSGNDDQQVIRLSRFTRPDGSTSADKESELILIEQKLGPTKHRGGGLVFGFDGFLYLSIGDLGYPEESQNIQDRLIGGVIRIDVDKRGGDISHPIRKRLQDIGEGTTQEYFIPNDNPFLSEDGSMMEEYYTVGCRNPHRMTIDRETGKMYIGNVGSGDEGELAFEEVNLVEKGANYGWPFREGSRDRSEHMQNPEMFRPGDIIGQLTDPIYFYERTNGKWICGGYVYRGTEIPSLYGKYIFADGLTKTIFSLELEGPNQYEATEVFSASDVFYTFGEDNVGELYMGSVESAPLTKIIPTSGDDEPANKDGFEGWYYLESAESGLVAEVAGMSEGLGANVRQWRNVEGAHQQWLIEKQPDNSYRIMAGHSRHYMDVNEFGTEPGANIHQWEWTGADNQRWELEAVGDLVRIKSKLSGLSLSIEDSVLEGEGANIQLGRVSEEAPATQLWKLIPVPGKNVQGSGQFPRLLSETGAFTDMRNLVPAPGVLPYTINTALWSDSARKIRFVAIPNDGTFDSPDEQVKFVEKGESVYPEGTVFFKHFDLNIDENNPSAIRRLETRVMVKGTEGFYALTYRWFPDGSDAELLEGSLEEDVQVVTKSGETRTQTWYYPSREECFICHTKASSRVLGPQMYQLNGDLLYKETGIKANQLVTWNHLGIFEEPIDPDPISAYISTKAVKDDTASLTVRVQSYLDANCSSCHMPGTGNRGKFNAKFYVPLEESGIVNGDVVEDFGIDGAKVVVPGDTAKSILYLRMKQVNTATAMPPLGKGMVDTHAVKMVADWILGMVPKDSDTTVVTPPVNLNGSGLTATFFETNELSQFAFSIIDSTLDLNLSSPELNELKDKSSFSVRWEGEIEIQQEGFYTFFTESADNIRLWVNDQMIITNWRKHNLEEDSATILLNSVGRYPIKIEYAEHNGNPTAKMSWAGPGLGKQAIDKGYLYPGEVTMPETYYTFTSRFSQKLMGVLNASEEEGANIVQWENDTLAGKCWEFQHIANNEYILKNHSTGLVAEAQFEGDWLGTNVVQATYKELASQRWTIEPAIDGYIYVKNVNNGYYLDVDGFSLENGGNLHLWEKHGGENQQWRLTVVEPPQTDVVTAIEDELDALPTLEMYPNPTTGPVTFKFDSEHSDESFDISVLNLTGQILWEQKMLPGTQSTDLGHLPTGMYLVRISHPAKGHRVQRLLIE